MAVSAAKRLEELVNPALIEEARKRSESIDNRIADRITTFSGSMRFVWLHAICFACWIGLGVEAYTYALLTTLVPLAAIILSSFGMISQNPAPSERQVPTNQER